mmetsp:Transcript_5680/g.13826  ORF Transcript_5680/g.13826 Transcript_5680/m.13826 type:complete len:1293 (-) Transcript_5680:418-4296(-)|eukprot:CAMPEP_0114523136 /NCGR_PEP_ID=MMETSP0109-20121206/21125_1 /TAXON_ID=29199 /ORGANISM="Chlorarachnion reptans, Strain CCCM449" /LENGTH=1292 /DNA_ID=CAMNT_0001704421 /DNA_START=161 /DNA_END=4039 /DNA_ORIENTATION=+
MSKIFPDVQKLGTKIQVTTGSPNIEVPNEAITYDSGWHSTKYLTAPAFETKFGKEHFGGELKEITEVWELLEEGNKLVAMLYTFRSCSQALKDVQTNQNTPKDVKLDVYTKEYKIFRPEIEKLYYLMNFVEKAVDKFKHLIQSLTAAEKKKEVISQLKLDLIVKLLDLLIKLDKLKDMKSNLVNDFARYKRAVSLVKEKLPNKKALDQEVYQLQNFLCNPAHPQGLIIWSAKEKLKEVANATIVVCLLLQHCNEALDTSRYLLPDEEHMLFRVIVYLMYILDSEKEGQLNAFRDRRAGFVMGLFKQYPVIPLFGDMQIQIKYDLNRCTHWTDQLRDQIDDTSARIKSHYILDEQKRLSIRAKYSIYTSKFCSLINRIRSIKKEGTDYADKLTVDLCTETYNTVLEGLRYISAWNANIRIQTAYKCSHPLDEKTYRKKGGEGGKGHEYERVVRYAYDQNELSRLVDIIGMIKGLGSLMQESETIFIDLCWRYIHNQVQTFVHAMLARPMRKAFKSHKNALLEMMKSMRFMCLDAIKGSEKIEDYKQVKTEIQNLDYKFPTRFTPPTVDQVVLLRRMMNHMCSDRAEDNKGGMFKKRTLKKEWQDEWIKLYKESFFFQYVLNFKQSLRESMDLSFLWYREFYLNMTKQPQFPIDMSMPWILTKFVIKGVQMKENIFYPMEIYNDAAEMALSFLDQRYLFDEIEAEVNLAFDQLLIHLSKEIFKYFKTLAGSILLDNGLEAAYDKLKSGVLQVPVSRYNTLMSQQTVRLLGRVVNLQVLLAQHVLNEFRKNLSLVLRKFQSNPLSSAVETKSYLDNARLAHGLASKHLPLDPFSVIVKEFDGRVSLNQGCGRIASHIADELVGEVLPNWTFCSGTRRFVPAVVSYGEKYTREVVRHKAPRYYWYGNNFYSPNDFIQKGFRKYFGAEHIHALLDIIEAADVPFILKQVLGHIETNLGDLMQSMEKVQQVLQRAPIPFPQSYTGPAIAYQGLLSNGLIKAVMGWPALKTVFFQSLREIGNSLAFVHLLEVCLGERSDMKFSQVAFYLGALPQQDPKSLEPFSFDPQANSPFYEVLTQAYSKLGGNKVIQQEMKANMDKAEMAMKVSAAQAPSIFSATLKRVSDILQNVEVFDGADPANGVLDTHSGSDFARVFSVAQFVFCISPSERKEGKAAIGGGLEEHAILGDGFAWGGCALVYLLGYASRFEMLDLCNQILGIAEAFDTTRDLGLTPAQQQKLEKSMPKTMNLGASLQTGGMKKFMVNARNISKINEVVFSTMRSYLSVDPVKDLRFSPPKLP